MRRKINSYKENDGVKNYPSKFEYDLSNESKNSLEEFINKIKTFISPINETYSEDYKIIKQQLEEQINSFGDYVYVYHPGKVNKSYLLAYATKCRKKFFEDVLRDVEN